MVYADRGKDVRDTPNVVFMVVADDQVVELPYAKLVVVRQRLVAAPADHVPADVERDGLATGRNQDRRVALADVDEVKLQLAIGLRPYVGSSQEYTKKQPHSNLIGGLGESQ
jgi:hypothetical protein